MTHTPDEIAAMIERAQVRTDADAVYDNIVRLRWQTTTDLPRLTLLNAFELLDDERADLAAMLRDVAAERDALKLKQTIRGLNCSLHFPCDHYKAAEAERDRLAAMVEKLRGYAVHDVNCNRVLSCRNYECTCGLSDVLKESEK